MPVSKHECVTVFLSGIFSVRHGLGVLKQQDTALVC